MSGGQVILQLQRLSFGGPMAKAKSKSPSEDELRRQHERFMVRWRSLTSLGRTLIITLGVISFGYVTVYMPIEVSHGEETVISHVNHFVANIDATVYLAWGAAASAAFWGKLERSQKLAEREVKDKRIRELEKQLDPNVTSSQLDVSGDNNVKGKK